MPATVTANGAVGQPLAAGLDAKRLHERHSERYAASYGEISRWGTSERCRNISQPVALPGAAADHSGEGNQKADGDEIPPHVALLR